MPKRHGTELTATQAAFCLEYEANGRNATRAYMATHPNAQPAGAAVNGYKMLRIAKVADALAKLRALREKHLTMTADEAAALVGVSARADIRLAYKDGKLLPPDQWPDELAGAVQTIRPDGVPVLHNQLKARETVLLMQGKLKQVVDVNHFDHVGYLAKKNQQHKERANATGEQDAATGAAAEHRGADQRPRKGRRGVRQPARAGA